MRNPKQTVLAQYLDEHRDQDYPYLRWSRYSSDDLQAHQYRIFSIHLACH
ncbi:Uncharacterised protein [Vibrio cholerae]|nr:Uncharacterised protein [Vibrio cholerae]